MKDFIQSARRRPVIINQKKFQRGHNTKRHMYTMKKFPVHTMKKFAKMSGNGAAKMVAKTKKTVAKMPSKRGSIAVCACVCVMSGCRDAGVSGCRGVGVSGSRGVGVSGCRGVGASGCTEGQSREA